MIPKNLNFTQHQSKILKQSLVQSSNINIAFTNMTPRGNGEFILNIANININDFTNKCILTATTNHNGEYDIVGIDTVNNRLFISNPNMFQSGIEATGILNSSGIATKKYRTGTPVYNNNKELVAYTYSGDGDYLYEWYGKLDILMFQLVPVSGTVTAAVLHSLDKVTWTATNITASNGVFIYNTAAEHIWLRLTISGSIGGSYYLLAS